MQLDQRAAATISQRFVRHQPLATTNNHWVFATHPVVPVPLDTRHGKGIVPRDNNSVSPDYVCSVSKASERNNDTLPDELG